MTSDPQDSGAHSTVLLNHLERECAYWESQCDRLHTELKELKSAHDRWREAFEHLERQSTQQINELGVAVEFWKREHAIVEANLATQTKELKDGLEFWKKEHAAIEASVQQWVAWYAEAKQNGDMLKAINEQTHGDLQRLHSRHEDLNNAYQRVIGTRMYRAVAFLRRVFKARP
jgi:chromosome segregation ATPase